MNFTKKRSRLHLLLVKSKTRFRKPGSINRCLNYIVQINDSLNFYNLYKDIFITRIYHFISQHSNPLIIDCGSNIGMSILFFKHIYPMARIIGFEPDPAVFPYLKKNIKYNALENVQIIQAALSSKEDEQAFYSDGKYGSCLADQTSSVLPKGWIEYKVPCVRLRNYLTEPVDLLKMNIEGAEYDVLMDSSDKLKMIRRMIIEYHHLPGLPVTLHKILTLLHEQGFDYLLNDFDSETNPSVRPPFYLSTESKYFLLIYAQYRDSNAKSH